MDTSLLLMGYERTVDSDLPDKVHPAQEYNVAPHAVVLGGPGRDEWGDLVLDLDVLHELVAYVVKSSPFADRSALDDESKNQMDGWLAPRLHAAIRIPRRLAADRRFWSWIALNHASPYVAQRFAEPDETVTRWRYTGALLRNAISRLWWGAEMSRNGADYQHVSTVFARTRTAQFALELLYSNYRPAPIAFSRVAEGSDGGARLTDAEMKLLSTRLNALLSLRSLEGMGTSDTPRDDDFGHAWYSERPVMEELTSSELPDGPPTNSIDQDAIRSLEEWFRKCIGDAVEN